MTQSSPLVSIGLPVYNGDRFLSEALNSLLAQAFTDYELIIVDNASTDGTANICESYSRRDSRIRYVRNPSNIGLYGNFNKTFQLAVGQYFKWAAVDDICHPDLLAKCAEVLDRDPAIVATYAKVSFVDADCRPLNLIDPGWHLTSDSAVARLEHVITAGHWVNIFFGLTRSKALRRTRLFPAYPNGDYRLIAELSLQGKFFEIPERLFFRRIHSDASTQNRDLDWQSSLFRGKRSHMCLPTWYLMFDQSTTILRSELTIGQKLSLLAIMGKRMLRGRRSLVDELHVASKSYLQVLSGRGLSGRID